MVVAEVEAVVNGTTSNSEALALSTTGGPFTDSNSVTAGTDASGGGLVTGGGLSSTAQPPRLSIRSTQRLATQDLLFPHCPSDEQAMTTLPSAPASPEMARPPA